MKQPSKPLFVLTVATGLALLAASVVLVNERYRMRELFIEHERAIDMERRLKDDQAELLMRVRRASLPGRISETAGAFGLVPADGAHTIVIEPEASKDDSPSKPSSNEEAAS